MSQPWSPEIALSKEEAKRLIERQFPELKPIHISDFGKGFDNTVFNVNKKYIFRFPRKEIAVRLLNTENSLLPMLVKELNIPIPEPIFFGKPCKEYMWPFTGYHLVYGDSPGSLTDNIRNQSAVPLALFFKRLHQFPVRKAQEIGVPLDYLERTNIGKRKETLSGNMKKLVSLHLISNDHQVFNWFENLKSIQVNLRQALVHGDCHIRNILVDKSGVISGIIDWGDTHIGDPAIDLSIAYSFLPKRGREEFFKMYGEVSNETKSVAQFFAVYVSIVLLLYGHDLGDKELVRSALESLKLSLD